MIPQKLKLGTRTISIVIKAMDDTLFGYYDQTNLEIGINANYPRPFQVETFWHEVVHAIFDYIRFQNEIQMELASGEQMQNLEERVTENFAMTFLQLIQDNNLNGIK